MNKNLDNVKNKKSIQQFQDLVGLLLSYVDHLAKSPSRCHHMIMFTTNISNKIAKDPSNTITDLFQSSDEVKKPSDGFLKKVIGFYEANSSLSTNVTKSYEIKGVQVEVWTVF